MSIMSMPSVSIGLPTFNRPALLEEVLNNFKEQSFKEFELLISDNASPDPKVREICEHFARNDHRFRYVRHLTNRGAEANFWYVYNQARAPFFLWASDDDIWPPDFLEQGVRALESHPGASAWFCQVANINIAGRPARNYPSFARFSSTKNKRIELARFLWEPEVVGKANLIFSMFRREALRETVDLFREQPSSWGSDMNLVYGFLCRHNIVIDDRSVLLKRISAEFVDANPVPREHIYPWSERKVYFGHYVRVARGTRYHGLTIAVLFVRRWYDFWYHGRIKSEAKRIVIARLAGVAGAIQRVGKFLRNA